MLHRTRELAILNRLLQRFTVVGIIGARQVGKTTLARALKAQRREPSTYFALENPEHLARLADPMLALKDLRGLVFLDEIQRQPELLPVLRVLADRPRRPARFVVLGSAAPSCCAKAPRAWQDASPITSCADWRSMKSASRIAPACGCAAASRAPIWPRPTP